MSQHSSPEEYLRLTDTVQVVVKFQTLDHTFNSLFPVHEAPGNGIRSEQFISLSEFLEENPVGEALTANTDAF